MCHSVLALRLCARNYRPPPPSQTSLGSLSRNLSLAQRRGRLLGVDTHPVPPGSMSQPDRTQKRRSSYALHQRSEMAGNSAMTQRPIHSIGQELLLTQRPAYICAGQTVIFTFRLQQGGGPCIPYCGSLAQNACCKPGDNLDRRRGFTRPCINRICPCGPALYLNGNR